VLGDTDSVDAVVTEWMATGGDGFAPLPILGSASIKGEADLLHDWWQRSGNPGGGSSQQRLSPPLLLIIATQIVSLLANALKHKASRVVFDVMESTLGNAMISLAMVIVLLGSYEVLCGTTTAAICPATTTQGNCRGCTVPDVRP